MTAFRVNPTDIEGADNNGLIDYYLTKIDMSGNILWRKMYGGSGDDILTDVVEIDGGYIIVGRSVSNDIDGLANKGFSDCYIIEIDETGNVQWQTMYGGDYSDEISKIIVLDDGYVFAGDSGSSAFEGVTYTRYDDYLVFKTNKIGDIIWQNKIGGTFFTVKEDFKDIIETSDGGFLMIGNSHGGNIDELINSGSKDCYIVKIDNKGQLIWHKLIGSQWDDYSVNIVENAYNEYIFFATMGSSNINEVFEIPNHDYQIIKLNINGDIIWSKNVDRADDVLQCVIKADDGGYVLNGHSVWEVYETGVNIYSHTYYNLISKINENGVIQWQSKVESIRGDISIFENTEDGGYLTGGCSLYSLTGLDRGVLATDIYIYKLDSMGKMVWQKMIGGDYYENLFGVYKTFDGNYFAFGQTTSTEIEGMKTQGEYNIFFAKLENIENDQTDINGDDYEYIEYAEDLSEIGVFKGSDKGFELDRQGTRIEAMIMFIRLLGKEEEALSNDWEHPFNDVPHWADRYIGWAYQNAYTNGISENEYGTGFIQANSFITLVLRALGYDDLLGDFDWESAVSDADTLGLLSPVFHHELYQDTFLRKHMAKISYDALNFPMKDKGVNLIDWLVEIGAFDRSKINFLLMK
ncbi:MAG: hypothetical protein JW702_08100 [Clostridiales bacterium]|nr:hypothetical protein [Clostridiales bacterium]